MHFHTILEGLEIKLLEKGSFGCFYFFVLSGNLEVFGDFNLSLDDLGRDVKGVEEVDLRGIESSGSCRDGEIDGGESTDSGFSGYFVGFDLSLEVINGGLSEDEGDLLLEEGGEGLKLWNFSSILFFEIFEFFFLNAVSSHFKSFFDEGLNVRGATFLEMTS